MKRQRWCLIMLAGLAAAALAVLHGGCIDTLNVGDYHRHQDDGGGACIPEATTSCYDGPPGTEGQGICKAGLRTCGANGTYGPCIGQVMPKKENCATPQDEDCDGLAPPCKGTPLWSKHYGDLNNTNSEGAFSVSAD